MGIAGTNLTYEETVTSRVSLWKAAIDKASEILGDVEPISIVCRASEISVHLRHKDFVRLFTDHLCTRTSVGDWNHWSRQIEDVSFDSCERVNVANTIEIFRAPTP